MESARLHRPAGPKRKVSDLSGQPADERASAPRAPAGRRRNAGGKAPPAGPGGLGYLLALDEREAREIDWHGGDDHPHAPPAPRQGH